MNPLVYVLLASTALAMLMGKTTDVTVIFGVVDLNTLIGFVQESQAGDQISADMRLTQIRSLQCGESALTGESVPVLKRTGPVAVDAMLGDRKCMAFSGTLVTAGAASGIVVVTGSGTEFGRISQLLEQAVSLKTPLTQSLERLPRWITFAILLVATIPEGLPAIITIASAVGVKRMARRRAVIRHLIAVETLGSTNVNCSDKTGTPTLNRMTVQSVWTPGGEEATRVEALRALLN